MGIGRSIRAALAGMALAWLGLPVAAQDLSALARMDAGASAIFGSGDEVQLTLALSQPVPWRMRFLDGPPRLILDFREVDFTALDKVPVAADSVVDLRAGVFRQGWSRLVMELAGPMKVVSAEMVTDGAAQLKLHLAPDDPTDFAKLAAAPEPPAAPTRLRPGPPGRRPARCPTTSPPRCAASAPCRRLRPPRPARASARSSASSAG